MTSDLMNYDNMVQNALRHVVRDALIRVEKEGLIGEHHFYIAFDTNHPGVTMSDTLKAKYPEEMTIVLQHKFWGLKVDPDRFEVNLSFNQIPELLIVPFSAVRGFYDPSVQFGLQFHSDDELASELEEAVEELEASIVLEPDHELDNSADDEDDQKTGEVVSLADFRKK